MSESEVLWQCLPMSKIIHFHSHLTALSQAHVKYTQSKGTNKTIILAQVGKEEGSFGLPETWENQDVVDGEKLGLPKKDSSTQTSTKQLV